VLTRRELAALALAAAATPVAGCGGLPKSEDALVWADVGPLDDIPEGRWWDAQFTVEGLEELGPLTLFVRRDGDRIAAMERRCTHLGCPVRWVEHSERFICPCHGAVFDNRGRPEFGPAKRPLARWKTRVRDGRLQVAKPRRASGESS
jgi:quinol---cytochrome c reductase iron-sulfur subunit, bacillus type